MTRDVLQVRFLRNVSSNGANWDLAALSFAALVAWAGQKIVSCVSANSLLVEPAPALRNRSGPKGVCSKRHVRVNIDGR
jgi:hypothetical protein